MCERIALRDYFAAHAPEPPSSYWVSAAMTKYKMDEAHALPTNKRAEAISKIIEEDLERKATWSYTYADAMMRAREK